MATANTALLLGIGVAPLTQAHSDAQARSLNTAITKTDRATLTDKKALQLLISNAIAPMEHKFSLMSADNDNDLKNIYDLGLRIRQFETSLQDQDIIDVFTLSSIINEAQTEHCLFRKLFPLFCFFRITTQ